MSSYSNQSTLVLFGGFQTEWGYFGGPTNVSGVVRDYSFETMNPEGEKARYYFDDTWVRIHHPKYKFKIKY